MKKMITYALSAGAFGSYVTPLADAALRRTKIRNYELNYHSCLDDTEQSIESAKRVRQLVAAGVIRPVSFHLPFCGGNGWDPSSLDEEKRKDVSFRMQELIRKSVWMKAPNITLHASNEPPLEEHPQRIGQVCRTIEEFLPLAEEMHFSINVEFLPRRCVGNCVEELQKIVSNFDPKYVGICFDVNHIMNRYRELPQMIDTLAPRIRTFHLSDYDGVDEMHWIPGQGLIDWPEVLRHIKAIDHDVVLILETHHQLQRESREIDPIFSLRQNEAACWYLENSDRIRAEIGAFRIPGNN